MIGWKQRLTVCILAAALAVAGCSVPQPVQPAQLVDIHWESADGWERAGLVVAASVAGQRGLFQLDTGARTTLSRPALDLCGIPYQLGQAVNWDNLPGAHWATVADMSLGEFHINRLKVIVWDDQRVDQAGKGCDEATYLGNLGWDFIGKGTLYLDFRNDGAAVFRRRPQLSGRVVSFSRLVGGRPVVTVRVGSSELEAILDTGTSPLTLLVAPDEVVHVVGPGRTATPANEFVASSWGRPVTITRYVADVTASLDGAEFRLSEFYASPLITTLQESTQHQVAAILGNEAFRGMCIALDFQARELILVGD